MELKTKLPHNRSYQQILNHYTVEKSIADALKNASRDERKKIYATMYDELFEKVPDHPRLEKRDAASNDHTSQGKTFKIVEKFVNKDSVFVEFAPGDCTFAYFMCKIVRSVYAIDISIQSSNKAKVPSNFTLHIYDGYTLNNLDNMASVVFSDQFIEHLHPEDVELHFKLVNRILKKNGTYLFKTPHAFYGPWDVSLFFSNTPQGFHLKEWTFTELGKVLKDQNYSQLFGYWRVLKNYKKIPLGYFKIVEKIIGIFPKKIKKNISKLFIPRHIVMIAVK